MEKWIKMNKPYENYSISNQGRIKNNKTNYVFRKNSNMVSGYSRVCLNGKYFLIHRLVAEYFIPKLNNCKEVHHINMIRNDNIVENLEWISVKTNRQKKKHTNNKSRPVEQYTLDGKFIKKWEKISEIHFGGKNISSACAGRLKHAYGYIWKYYEDFIEGEKWKEVILCNRKIEVSNKGRVKLSSGKITSGWIGSGGYKVVSFNGIVKRVHVLIAEAFLNKLEGKDLVDHIDRNRENNCVENLRWVNSYENRKNSKEVKRNVRKTKVIRIDKYDNNEVEYSSIHEASDKNGISKGNICSVCNGKRKTAGGYRWKK